MKTLKQQVKNIYYIINKLICLILDSWNNFTVFKNFKIQLKHFKNLLHENCQNFYMKINIIYSGTIFSNFYNCFSFNFF
jgi:hypothetical protein